MLKAMLYDVGGVFHIPYYDDALKQEYAIQMHDFLLENGIDIGLTPMELEKTIAKGTKEYKYWGENSEVELPSLNIWRDFVFKGYDIPEEKLIPIAVELSDRHNARRRRDVRPHLIETCEQVRQLGLRQGVISNVISERFIPSVVKEYGLDDYMECIIQSSIVGVRKPSPKLFEAAIDELGNLTAGECAYVGDTISRDIAGSREAGIGIVIQIINPTTVGRDQSYLNNECKPDYVIKDILEIPSILKRHML